MSEEKKVSFWSEFGKMVGDSIDDLAIDMKSSARRSIILMTCVMFVIGFITGAIVW